MSKKFDIENIENQAARFISGVKNISDADPLDKTPGDAHENPLPETGYPVKKNGRPKIKDREIKSKRINVLILPSIADKLKKVSAVKRTSVNDLINTYLNERLDQEADALMRFDEVFGEKI
jgi:hypothetical protein